MSRTSLRSLSGFICQSCQHRISPLTTEARGLLVPSSRRKASTRSTSNKSSSLNFAQTYAQGDGDVLASIFNASSAPSSNYDPAAISAALYARDPQPHRIHILATKHNTHITLTRPAPRSDKPDPELKFQPPPPNLPVMSFAAGNIGFKKAGRGTYDAAYQLASYFFRQIQERGLLAEIKQVEVVLREFGAGREAVTKAILGQEGRNVRPRIVAVQDATRRTFGGSRSPNPRRLG